MSALPTVEVEIPYAPRTWARKLHRSFKRKAALILHRRAGKTTAVLNHHQRAALDDEWEMARLQSLLPDKSEAFLRPLLKHRVYWHVMPTLTQARLVAWDILKEISSVVPGAKPNISEMLITYPNGNKLQLRGADDPDSLRGPGLSGLSLDEYSQIPPKAYYEVLSKALADHLGYVIFGGTIQGKDQLYELYHGAPATAEEPARAGAKDDPEWYAVWQDIDVSLQTEAGPTVSALMSALEDDRRAVLKGQMTQAAFDQEWYLSPEAAIKGAIYGKELAALRLAGQITRVPHDPALPVDTDWDLGVGDSTAIWFSQSLRSGEVRLIDYYEASGEGFPHYAKVLRGQGLDGPTHRASYVYGKHWGPHDIQVREFGTGKTRLETAASYGIRFEITPRLTSSEKGAEVEEGINAGRLLLPRCWFDSTLTDPGLEALSHYRREYNERLQEFRSTPVHDWSSHGADAFRGLAVRHQVPVEQKRQQAASAPRDFQWA